MNAQENAQINQDSNNLINKSVVVLCPRFYEYEDRLQESLEAEGYVVHPVFYDEDEMLYFTWLNRILLRFFNTLFGSFHWYRILQHKSYYKKSIAFFDKRLADIKNKEFDYLLVVKGFGLHDHHLEAIKAKYKVMYQWDLISNYPLVPAIYKHFDKVFTFDISDSAKGWGVFLPTFYVRRGIRKQEAVYDLFFVGEYTKLRFELLKKIVSKADSLGLTYFIKLMKPNTFFIDKKYSHIFIKKPMSRAEYDNYFDSSRLILEMPHEGQIGSTQRLLEGLEQEKIVCTTGVNKSIKTKSVILLDDFLAFNKSEYDSLLATKFNNEDIISNFELSNWLDIVFSKDTALNS